MKSFAISEGKKIKKRYYSVRTVSILFGTILVILFAIISFFAKINMRTKQQNKIDLFSQNLDDIAFYFWPIDKDVANMLVGIKNVSNAYLSGENVLQTKQQEVDDLMYYVRENTSYLESLGFKKYIYLINLVTKLWVEKDEMKKLLGVYKPQNYLVILQNTNEKRPNGGFFGSFAFITLDKARITNLEIVDAYYPSYFAPKAFLSIPKDEKELFFNTKDIKFIAANKYGFTDKDGKNIKTLYEMAFNSHYDKQKLQKVIKRELHEKLLHQYIKGVIFVRLDLFTKYFPELEKQSKERQFVNANIDLIRGKVEKNKKEKYIKEANLFFEDNWKSLFKAITNNLEEIIKQRGIGIYLSNVSSSTQKILQENNLTTIFNTGSIYFWDTNIANNKMNAFIEKQVEIYNQEGVLVGATDNDILDIRKLFSGEYTVKIYYTFNIQENYIQFMKKLEQQYGIIMTEREKSILGLAPSSYISMPGVPRYWGTQAHVYFPKNIIVKDITGAVESTKTVNISFARVGMYKTFLTKNNQTKIVELKIQIP